MTLDEFRIRHSTLIEHYQFIEAHLEGIYAAVSDKPFREAVQEVERNSLSGVVREIKETDRDVLTEEEYTQLDHIIDRRNYWCHSCYFELPFDRETGGPAKVRDAQKLCDDLKTAEQWRERLRRKKKALLAKKQQ